jgi:hypothetical protein
MADQRYSNDSVIVDGTTKTQQLAIDASGRASVSLTASSATVTVDSELAVAAALTDGFANPTTSNIAAMNMVWNGTTWDRAKQIAAAMDTTGTGILAVGVVGQLDDTTTQTVTENQFAAVRISTRRALLVEGVASGTNINVNLAASAATVTVDTELTAVAALSDALTNPTITNISALASVFNGTTWDRARGAAALADALANPGTGLAQGQNFLMIYNATTWDRARGAVTLADALANPGAGLLQGQNFLMGYNGSTWDRVRVANTGRLQVDVVTGGSADTPTNPIVKTVTIAALASGSSSTTELRTVDLGGLTKKLTKIHVWGSVAFKADLQTVANAIGTSVVVGGGHAFTAYSHTPPGDRTGRNYYSVAHPANAGFDGWQIIVTNLDASEAADFYAVIYYED